LSSIARRYATALSEVALKNGEAREVQEELLGWQRMIASSDLFRELLVNPTIPYSDKDSTLNQLIARAGVRKTTANFLRVLLKNQRLSDLEEINRRFAQVLDEKAGLLSAEVITARPVPDAAKGLILADLRKITGKEVRVNFSTDEELIGGAITRIGSTVYDGSIKNQLQELGKKLAGN
jgi:F-type H+-transporting ATPase subunit delta